MDAAASPAVETPLQAVPDQRPVLIDADLVVADVSDRALRMALLLGWHDDHGDEHFVGGVSDAALAQQLRCSLADVRACWAELQALRGISQGFVLPFRHACEDGPW